MKAMVRFRNQGQLRSQTRLPPKTHGRIILVFTFTKKFYVIRFNFIFLDLSFLKHKMHGLFTIKLCFSFFFIFMILSILHYIKKLILYS